MKNTPNYTDLRRITQNTLQTSISSGLRPSVLQSTPAVVTFLLIALTLLCHNGPQDAVLEVSTVTSQYQVFFKKNHHVYCSLYVFHII